jgi:DnaK suppressor protein
VCIEQTADAMDQVQAAAARELAIGNLDRSARWLRDIQEALCRLDIGEYGTCLNCEEEIGAKRLRAVPWAQLCLRCQFADRTDSKSGHYAAEPLRNAA